MSLPTRLAVKFDGLFGVSIEDYYTGRQYTLMAWDDLKFAEELVAVWNAHMRQVDYDRDYADEQE